MSELSINLLFPVLNERLRLENGIERSMEYLKKNVKIPYQLTILDNGSDDETPEIGMRLAEKYEEVSYVRVGERGVGVAFRKGIELNTAGFKYGLDHAHPVTPVLKRYKELGGEIITLGSDGHAPEQIAWDFEKVPAILREAGFEYFTVFHKRKPEFVKIY